MKQYIIKGMNCGMGILLVLYKIKISDHLFQWGEEKKTTRYKNLKEDEVNPYDATNGDLDTGLG